MRRVRVEVTAEDIEGAKPCDAYECPVARAAARAGLTRPTFWPGAGELFFGEAIGNHMRDRVVLNQECCDFGHKFDTGQPVEPFSFEIEVPDAT